MGATFKTLTMKVRLLKKLRKEARKQYGIIRSVAGFHCTVFYESLHIEGMHIYNKIEEAQNEVERRRAAYILNEVYRRRGRYDK